MSDECNVCGHNGCVEDNHPDPDLRDAEEYTRHMAQARKHHGALAYFVAEYDARARRIANLEAGRDVEQQALRNAMAMITDLQDDLARARSLLAEATGTLPAYGLANDELGDPWVRWLERVRAYLGKVDE